MTLMGPERQAEVVVNETGRLTHAPRCMQVLTLTARSREDGHHASLGGKGLPVEQKVIAQMGLWTAGACLE